MPPLIYVQPDKGKWTMTPEQYAALVQSLQENKNVSGFSVTTNSGTVTYEKITFVWIYDGSTELTIQIAQDHNWEAKIAGNDAIFKTLDEQLISKV